MSGRFWTRAAGKDAQHEAQVVERAAEPPLVGRDVRPDTDYSYPVHLVDAVRTVPVAVVDPSGREVGRPGDDGDLVSVLYPHAGVFVGPERRGVRLRGEVVCEKQDLQECTLSWVGPGTGLSIHPVGASGHTSERRRAAAGGRPPRDRDLSPRSAPVQKKEQGPASLLLEVLS